MHIVIIIIMRLKETFLGEIILFILTLTGAGDASTWQFNCTSDPRGAPNN